MARVKGIDHIGIAVKNADEAARFYTEALGLALAHAEVVEGEAVKVNFLPVGEATIELLEATNPDSPIAKFIERRGEGLHHICLEVEGIEDLLQTLAERGAVVGSAAPRQGGHGTRVGFLHPKATGGVLIELAEKDRQREGQAGE
ncbi:MAG: methylmalonyl-CoA epimerase [Chloroflexota bacterium]